MTIEYFIENWRNIKEDIEFTKEDWIDISEYQYLEEEFIEKYKDKVNWGCISYYQKLSESFIEKYQNKVNWGCISSYQKLTDILIIKNYKNINYCYLKKHNKNIKYTLYESIIGGSLLIL